MADKDIKEKIKEYKEIISSEIFVDGKDVLEMYIRIAFSNIKDFVNIEEDEKGKNYVKIKNLEEIDGRIVDEISFTSSGGRVKLCDKFKALEKLEKFFDLFGIDSWNRFIQEQKLNIKDSSNENIINVITGVERNDEKI